MIMPFRSHLATDITKASVGSEVSLSGWVHRCRDHGGVIFMDLRDHTGLCQVVFHPENKAVFALAEQCRTEFVIQVEGKVLVRPEGTENNEIVSGLYEVHVEKLEIINKSLPLPFMVDDTQANVGEETRLRYRYLDMRRKDLLHSLQQRAILIKTARRVLEANDFLEVETPTLTPVTPEGAREYLVPSRTQSLHAFALQQSPQQFKQTLMIGGVDRYYQVVKCFRDEDLRADRQPEFTQLDLEMAFANKETVIATASDIFMQCFEAVVGEKAPEIKQMSYQYVMERYGSDKPDLRNPLHFVALDAYCKEASFKAFQEPAIKAGHRVVGMRLPKGCSLTRKQLDEYTNFVAEYGAKGLAYIKINDAEAMDSWQSPIIKFFDQTTLKAMVKALDVQTGDCVFFGAGTNKVVNQSMDALRNRLAADLDLYTCQWAPVWVVDFPMFEQGDTEGDWHAVHHPFTAPSVDSVAALREHCATAKSQAYDLVLNGNEIAGGSVRIHDIDMQLAALDILGLDEAAARAKLGHLLTALQYGAPPHAGIAFGVDRFIMLLLGKLSIRDVIAFPKTQNATCMLTNAPSALTASALKELNLKSAALQDVEVST